MTTAPSPSSPSTEKRFFYTAIAFIKRDLLADLSYQVFFIWQFFTPIAGVLSLFFLSRLVGPGVYNQLAAYGGDYFGFAIVGTCVLAILNRIMVAMGSGVRYHRLVGTLEALMLTPTSPTLTVVLLGLYPIVLSIAISTLKLGAAALLGAHLVPPGLFPIVGALLLVLLAFIGLGLVVAAGTLVLERPEPVTYMVTGLSGLLGGVLYPLNVLPPPLQSLARLLPITPALELFRGILLPNAKGTNLLQPCLHLALFAAVLLPIGLVAVHFAITFCKKRGSILTY